MGSVVTFGNKSWELEPAEERLIAEQRLRAAGVPDRLRQVLASGVQETDAIQAVGEWNRGPKTFLFLAGGIGTGKSVAAAFAVQLHGGRWCRALDVVRLGQFEQEGIRQLERARQLVVDDLGAEPLDQSGWGASAILALLDSRYDGAARTVVTTNLTVDQVVSRYGQDGGRLVDRMREAGMWVTLTGPSLRVGDGR